jgi:hypothetical protein
LIEEIVRGKTEEKKLKRGSKVSKTSTISSKGIFDESDLVEKVAENAKVSDSKASTPDSKKSVSFEDENEMIGTTVAVTQQIQQMNLSNQGVERNSFTQGEDNLSNIINEQNSQLNEGEDIVSLNDELSFISTETLHGNSGGGTSATASMTTQDTYYASQN